jgi:hypothetical protein
LKLILERAVQDARRRQELLAAAAPSRYRGSGGGGNGGNGYASGGSFRSLVDVADYGEGDGSSTGTGHGASGNEPGGHGVSGSREMGIGRGGGNSFNEGYAGERSTRSGGDGQPGGINAPGQGRASSQDAQFGQGRPGEKYASGPASRRQGDGQSGGTQRAGSGQGGGGSARSGGNSGSGGQQGGSAAAAGDPSGEASANPSVNVTANQQPIANKKGKNWALPNYTQQATGITRPIRIRMEADRMLIVPERGERRAARVVAIESSMSKATENLVSQIWTEVDGWGIAVSNGYWKPVLNVEVTPGQDALYDQLETLLDGSGLEVRRRSP